MPYLDLFLLLSSCCKYLFHVLWEAEVPQSLLDVLYGYRLLRFFLGYIIRFRGNQGYEFDAAVDEQVAGVAGKGNVWRRTEDFVDYFRHGG